MFKSKSFKLYTQPSIWEKASSEIKMKARDGLLLELKIKIKWYDYLEKYKDIETVKLISTLKHDSEDKNIVYPSYFLNLFMDMILET